MKIVNWPCNINNFLVCQVKNFNWTTLLFKNGTFNQKIMGKTNYQL